MKRLLCALALVVFAAAPALADPKSDVMTAMIGLSKASSYHMEVTTKKGAMEADMALPGKMHVSTPQFEMIRIDSSTWMKIGGTWRALSIPGMDAQITGAFNGAIAAVKGEGDDVVVTDLGMKAPNSGGPAMHAYSVSNKAGKSPSTVFLAGGLPSEIDTVEGGTVKFSKFNAPVDIQPPM